MLNAISIDLEDWYHPELVRKFVSADNINDQISESTAPLLDVLDQCDVKATFFVLGTVAERHPQLIKEIYRKGHEVAAHGYSHVPLHLLGEKNFEDEMRKTTELLKDITGENPIGFRAPSFSMDQSTRWAFDVLEKLGYKYDSSIFPSSIPKLMGLYGVSNTPEDIYFPSRNDITVRSNGKIKEFPITVFNFCKLGAPFSGGFYLRFFPLRFIRFAIRRKNKENKPVVIFIHPWETYAKTPRLKLPRLSSFVTYVNIAQTLPKLERLLETFEFGAIRDVLFAD